MKIDDRFHPMRTGNTRGEFRISPGIDIYIYIYRNARKPLLLQSIFCLQHRGVMLRKPLFRPLVVI